MPRIAGLDADAIKEKFPTFRFSEEVVFMMKALEKALKHADIIPEEVIPA